RFVIVDWCPFYAPISLYCVGIAVSTTQMLKPKPIGASTNKLEWTILPTLFGIGLFNQAFNRADPIHLLPTSIVALVLLTALSYNVFKTSLWKRLVVAQQRRLFVRMLPFLVFL